MSKPKPATPTRNVTIRVPMPIYDRLKVLSKTKDRNMSNLVLYLVKRQLATPNPTADA